MPRTLLLFLLLLTALSGIAQQLKLDGNTYDTLARQPLPNSLLMVSKLKDSTLVAFSRGDRNGIFKPLIVPLDTYVVTIAHSAFGDRTYLLVPSPKDSVFHLKNVVLPPKSVALKEVQVLAYREKQYYKGDTLVFTADSFQTRPNATVEDLLKKLPGFKVDANGKITIQGKEVDQVLVDGDEFFGTDPTIATRNLNASSIENVQVYEKKNESTEEGKDETVKVLNLKMKDDAKKGYFGKASMASDFQQFYENELLVNRFKGNRKMSAFGLLANTPKQAFGHNDAGKFGLTGEEQWSYNEETGMWMNNNQRGTGVPQTLKTGFYFNDKLGKKLKINTDYTFNQNALLSGSETNTQFFLQDTSYVNLKAQTSEQKNQNHAFNLRATYKLDSLTELVLNPKVRMNTSDNSNVQVDDFVSGDDVLTRRTTLQTSTRSRSTDLNLWVKVTRNFMKKDRQLTLNYQPVYVDRSTSTGLNTDFDYLLGQLPDSSVKQQRTQTNLRTEHNLSGTYTEPWTKKLKSEFSYNYSASQNTSNRRTFDFSGSAYDDFNPALSNSFLNVRAINRAGTKLIYDVKKFRVSLGTYVREVYQENTDLSSGRKLDFTVRNVLPVASFNYRISQGSNFTLQYNSSSQQPEVMQMQPVIDNSDPNRISIGNPDLKPTFSNHVSLNYYFYKGISDVNFWTGANYGNTQNQISNTTTFDSLGRAVTQPINVNGNYYSNIWFGGGFPVKKLFKIYYNFNGSQNFNVSYVNGVRNVAENMSLNPGLNFSKSAEKYEMGLGLEYSYHIPKSNISVRSNQPYYSYAIEGNFSWKLPKNFIVMADGRYNNNGNRSPGYNLNYFILNATVGKAFLKTENLVISVIGNDILNQNISNNRYITSNQIVDTKTQIIRRYFLLRVLYKFNNQKTKVED